MSSDRIRAAEQLFDTIGNIDDRLIQEAQLPYRKATAPQRKSFTAIIALAATLTLIVGVLTATLIAKIVGSHKSDVNTDQSPDSYEETVIPQINLSQTLLDAESKAVKVTDDDIDFFDGKTSIVWKVEGESEYRMVSFTSLSDTAKLKAELQKQTQQIKPEDTESPECEVWITFGDGTVVSPYLKASAGNIGYAELFEYSPEIEPSEDLVYLINDLISD